MAKPASTALAEDIEAVIAWWREAGVDCLFDDNPRSLIARTGEEEPAPSSAPGGTAGADLSEAPVLIQLPGDLVAFRDWWLSEPMLDNGRLSGRVPPAGAQGAQIMVIVEQPEAEDGERLLSGTEGQLLDAVLAAMGLVRESVYLASVLPRHMPLPDWADLARRGLGQVLTGHINLVGPRHLILFGGNILPLIGNLLPKSALSSPRFNHEAGSMPVFVARALSALVGNPRFKAGLWNDWLAWKRDHPGG